MQDLYNNDWINIDGNSIHKTAIVHPNAKIGDKISYFKNSILTEQK